MDPTPIENTPATPLIEVALKRMKHAIVACELLPGTKLKVDALSKAYGLSSSPIREALNRLTQEGVVTAFENRGFRVAPVTMRDFDEICRLRILLESEALKDAMELGDDAWEGNVLAAFHRLSALEKKLGPDPVALSDDWTARHKTFHFALFSACRAPLLLNLIDSLFDRAERYRRYSALHRLSPRHKSGEHRNLMNAVLARDKEKALELHRKHIVGTRNRLAEVLERQSATLQ